jgi:uncharacterized membrane protein YvbJ
MFNYCPKCGFKVELKFKFCPKCGASFYGEQTVIYQKDEDFPEFTEEEKIRMILEG